VRLPRGLRGSQQTVPQWNKTLFGGHYRISCSWSATARSTSSSQRGVNTQPVVPPPCRGCGFPAHHPQTIVRCEGCTWRLLHTTPPPLVAGQPLPPVRVLHSQLLAGDRRIYDADLGGASGRTDPGSLPVGVTRPAAAFQVASPRREPSGDPSGPVQPEQYDVPSRPNFTRECAETDISVLAALRAIQDLDRRLYRPPGFAPSSSDECPSARRPTFTAI
jgi:hypothetical protein